jgi:hypothetical protein
MRPLLVCGLLTASLALAQRTAPPITIVLDLPGQYSKSSVQEMKREFTGVMKDSGLRFEWRLRSDVSQESFDHLVVVRFKGRCILEPVGYMYDERGPLAFTHSTDRVLQPFSEVECDKVTATVRSAMWGGDYARADLLLGRALARVVAHELVHMLSDSREHGAADATKLALSGRDLIASKFHVGRITPRSFR